MPKTDKSTAHPGVPPQANGSASDSDGCDHCDTFGGKKTYANQACLPINGRVRCIDWCIHHIVAALNAGGVRTVACCCGHGRQPGRIDLEDGRILEIKKGETMTVWRVLHNGRSVLFDSEPLEDQLPPDASIEKTQMDRVAFYATPTS